MIISHKYKYIFLKPGKVAGTSVEIALSKFCGESDIITPQTEYTSVNDSNEYFDLSRNYKSKGFTSHIKPKEIKKKISKDIWNNYFKFTIIRNPWDRAVSSFFWQNSLSNNIKDKINLRKIFKNLFNINAYIFLIKYITKKAYDLFFSLFKLNKFEKFVLILFIFNQYRNNDYYFNKKNELICDFYIRYENLENDYKKVCDILKMPHENLPKTKNKSRKNKKHYSKYYNKYTKKIIEIIYRKEINYFKYKFEKE